MNRWNSVPPRNEPIAYCRRRAKYAADAVASGPGIGECDQDARGKQPEELGTEATDRKLTGYLQDAGDSG